MTEEEKKALKKVVNYLEKEILEFARFAALGEKKEADHHIGKYVMILNELLKKGE